MTKRIFATNQFIAPAYGGGSFADIPGLIRAKLTGGNAALRPANAGRLAPRYDQVIVLFVDAFGWRFLERFQEHPLLRRFLDHGSATRLTSQFPSTTSAHVTTLYSGRPVGEHGVFEWFYYEPTVDAMIAPLLFSFAGDKDRDTLLKAGGDVMQILPPSTFYQELAALGVNVTLIQPKELVGTIYTNRAAGGATVASYNTLPEALVNLGYAVEQRKTPACHILYFPAIDSICHLYGPDTAQTDAEILAFLTLTEQWLAGHARDRLDNTLIMLIADHGQMKTDPATCVYVNQLAEFDKLGPLLRSNRAGNYLIPGGSPRDFFLYVKPDTVEEAQALLRQALEGRAEVVCTADLAAAGYFGVAPPSPTFTARCSELVILPYAGESVFWYEKDRFVQKYYGHHGGLTRAEMEIPLLLLEAER
jgi:hypothetical protein